MYVLNGLIPRLRMPYLDTHSKMKDRSFSAPQELANIYGPPLS